MAQRRTNGGTKALVIGGTTVLGGLLLYYLLSGAGSENNAPLIPDSIEKHLDRVVDTLNDKFGKKWVNLGIQTLEAGLYSVLPPNVVALVKAVHRAEQAGNRMGLSGSAKRRQAILFVQANGVA
jgi:hypothetical protein